MRRSEGVLRTSSVDLPKNDPAGERESAETRVTARENFMLFFFFMKGILFHLE
jgi:hypothetical protein